MRTTTQIEEVDGRLEQEYEQRLLEALREIREKHELDLQTVRMELETLYEGKVSLTSFLLVSVCCVLGWFFFRFWCFIFVRSVWFWGGGGGGGTGNGGDKGDLKKKFFFIIHIQCFSTLWTNFHQPSLD